MPKRRLSKPRCVKGSLLHSKSPRNGCWGTMRDYSLELGRSETGIVDEESGSSDIISRLVDMGLLHIAEKILLDLSELDVAKAVTANPKWAEVVTSRRRAEQFFSRAGAYAPLKTLYRRRELLSKCDERDARAIFEQACADSLKLDKLSAKSEGCAGVFKVVFPFDCDPSIETFVDVVVSNKYLAPVYIVWPEEQGDEHEQRPSGYVIPVYDRWTLQLANAVSVHDIGIPYVGFVRDSLIIHRRLGEWNNSVDVWNLATGRVHPLRSRSRSEIAHMFCVRNLIVLLKEIDCHAFVSVYKSDDDSAPELVVDDEPLPMRYDYRLARIPRAILSDESVDVFGIVGPSKNRTSWEKLYQLRSKDDFSLRTVFVDSLQTRSLDLTSAYLLGDSLIFVNAACGYRVDVLCLANGSARTVFTFTKPEEVKDYVLDARDICLAGDLLVLKNPLEPSATIWKLPSNFVETCHRHLEEGTVGTADECDQLLRLTVRHPAVFKSFCHLKVDRYGITAIDDVEIDGSVVMLVMMPNCIISDGDGYIDSSS